MFLKIFQVGAISLTIGLCMGANPAQTDESQTSATGRWENHRHKSLEMMENGVTLPTLYGIIKSSPRADTFKGALTFVGAMRRALAAATNDPNMGSYGDLRTTGFAYTPVNTYPLIYAEVMPICDEAGRQFSTDGTWHEYDEGMEYNLKSMSLAQWLEFCSGESTPEKGEAFGHIRMILYGEKDSIIGPAGILIQRNKEAPVSAEGKPQWVGSPELVIALAQDLEAFQKEEKKQESVRISSMEMRFRNTDIRTRQLFWVEIPEKPDTRAVTLFHPSGSKDWGMHQIMAKSFFDQTLQSTTTDELTKILNVLRFSYTSALWMPFARGSALCTEQMVLGLFHELGLTPPARDALKTWDEFAQTSIGFTDYVRKVFKQLQKDMPTSPLSLNTFLKPTVISEDPRWSPLKELDILTFPSVSRRTPLCQFMHDHNSDKSSARHTYTQLYYELLKDRVNTATHMLEIGVGSCDPQFAFTMGAQGTVGASLRAYRQFLPNATIYGADIDEAALKKLESEERIKCFPMDALKPESIERAFLDMNVLFDFIVDDGFHDYEANKNCLIEGLKHLKPDGLYIVEDVRTDQIPQFEALLATLSDWSAAIVKLPAFANDYDNNVVLLKRK